MSLQLMQLLTAKCFLVAAQLRSIDRLTDRLKGVLGKRKPAGDE